LTGLSGEIFFNHPNKRFRVGFSNPLVGACKGLIDTQDATEKPFDIKAKSALTRADDNNAQKTEFLETKYHLFYPPIYSIVLENF